MRAFELHNCTVQLQEQLNNIGHNQKLTKTAMLNQALTFNTLSNFKKYIFKIKRNQKTLKPSPLLC